MTTRKPASLWVKLGITMISVIVIALLMATTLNFLRFEETYQRLIAQRLDVTTQEIARVVVTGLDLGLEVRSQGHLAAFVDDYMVEHPGIRVSIFDCSGEVVIGREVDGSGHPWAEHVGVAQWRAFGESRVGVGTIVENNLGRCAAGISVETSSDSYIDAMQAVTTRFAVTGSLAAAAACLLILGTLLLFSRRSALRRLDDDLLRLTTVAPGATPMSENDFSDPWERMLARHYLDARPNLVSGQTPTGKERKS